MPQVPIRRKLKRGTVLSKRIRAVKKYYERRSYKPLYEKLKNNNSHLAKALSEEKQTSQTLFSQNVTLIGELQELRLACTTRDNVISNVLSNSKEILKMLVTMSGYLTNTISSCQEFVASNNLRLSSISATGRKESFGRLSTKSPTKGVVKPMVSGHTIRKPTINLSRINMEHINNSTRLSNIQEVPTPTRNQEIDETASSISLSIPITQMRYENGRVCRMPERLRISLPKIDMADNDQRLGSKRNRRSKRMSRSYPRSEPSRWSNEATSNDIGYDNQMGSVRVKLNDISKLLHNSPNLQTAIHGPIDVDVETQENDAPRDTSNRNIIISETQSSVNSDEQNETLTQTPKKHRSIRKQKKISNNKHFDKNQKRMKNSRLSQSNISWEDPLEGPSWLLNDNETISPHNIESKYDHSNVSNINNHTIRDNCSITTYNNVSNHVEDIQELSTSSNLNKCTHEMHTSERDIRIANHIEDDSSTDEDAAEENSSAVLPITITNHKSHLNNIENDNTTNFPHFVTLRRGHPRIMDEETEDFTLLLSRQPKQNVNFDINELRLPNLEGSIINPTTTNDIDSEVTTTIRRLTNISIPSISNNSMNESELDESTIRLPLLLVDDFDRVSTLENNKHSNLKNKKPKTANPINGKRVISTSTIKNKAKQKSKLKNNQDPSAAKVVLEKLNESHVNLRTPSPDNNILPNGNSYMKDISNEEGNTRDSENSVNDCSTRPRRRKAPINLKEPKLNKKLRRN